jgi:hypothetical protein
MAVLTNDGYLEVYGLHQQRFVRSHFLDNSVGRKVLITEGFGSILVSSEGEIWVFTVNGFLGKRVKSALRIEEWVSWNEMVGCADEDGRVFVFECGDPEAVRMIGSVHERVLGLKYDRRTNALIGVTGNGTLFRLPICL